jgi:hypothetical protein
MERIFYFGILREDNSELVFMPTHVSASTFRVAKLEYAMYYRNKIYFNDKIVKQNTKGEWEEIGICCLRYSRRVIIWY